MPEITLEPGSGAERFALHLRGNPGEYDRHSVAALLGIAPGAVESALQPGVDLAVITIANNGDIGRVWRPGPRLPAWKLAGSEAAAPKAASAMTALARKSNRGGRRNILPPLKLDQIKVSAEVPLPVPAISRPGEGRHDRMLDTLTADGMSVTGIPAAYQASLAKAVQVYLNCRPALKASSALYVRRMEDDAEHIGVWRVARPGADVPAKAAPKLVKRGATA